LVVTLLGDSTVQEFYFQFYVKRVYIEKYLGRKVEHSIDKQKDILFILIIDYIIEGKDMDNCFCEKNSTR
jgi:hypothetical protein